jgi:hypothetical protein
MAHQQAAPVQEQLKIPRVIRERTHLELELDLANVVYAFDAVDELNERRIGERQFEGLCRYAAIRCDVLAFRRAVMKHRQLASSNSREPTAGYLTLDETLVLLFAGFPPQAVVRAHTRVTQLRKVAAARRAASEAAASVVIGDRGAASDSHAVPEPSTSSSSSNFAQDDDRRRLRIIFGQCDTDNDGYVSYNDLVRVVKDSPKETLAELVLRFNALAVEIRAHDTVVLRDRTLWDLLRHAHVPTQLLSKLKTTPPLTVSNLISHWHTLRPQIEPHLSLPVLARVASVVTVLKRHGAMAVAKLAWPRELDANPPEFTVVCDLTHDALGAPRVPPVTLATARLSFAEFAEAFGGKAVNDSWNTFTRDEAKMNVPQRRLWQSLPLPRAVAATLEDKGDSRPSSARRGYRSEPPSPVRGDTSSAAPARRNA